MTEQLLPVFILLPLIGGALAMTGKLFRPLASLFRLFSLLPLLGVPALLVLTAPGVFSGQTLMVSLGGWPEPCGISLVMDGFAWVSAVLVGGIGLLVALFALSWPKYDSTFFLFYHLLLAGMYIVVFTGDLFTMFVGFEIIALAAYVLIAFEKTPTGLVASFKYLMLSSTGILFFLFGIFLIYRDLGTLSIAVVRDALAEAGGIRNTRIIHLALASLCVGIGVRTAFIPFHTWLPEAHAYAPHPVSALLSGVLIKISYFAMVRLLLQFGGAYLFDLLLWIGAVTALVAVISALAQSDAKRLLAYHSISQMGYILAVFSAGSAVALTASFAHALNHALFKTLLFLTVGTAVERGGDRNLYRLKPGGRQTPLFAAAYMIGALSISGIPPFNGYVSKNLITLGMKGSPAYILLWITGFCTLASFIKLSRIYLPGPKAAEKNLPDPVREDVKTIKRPGFSAGAAVTILAALCLGTGIFGFSAAGILHRLFYGVKIPVSLSLFSREKLFSLLPTVGLGIAVFFLVTSGKGKTLASRIKNLAPNLETVLMLFFTGLLLFSTAAYLP
ncbi:MAG: hypothetical protein JW760_10030 [Spirochaetales bacterium]|nr:hypothetical protein [Spirochaetales bacterium]